MSPNKRRAAMLEHMASPLDFVGLFPIMLKMRKALMAKLP
jgi:hypothetical protein